VFGIAAHGITEGWREARVERAVAANAEAVFRSPASPVAGNPEGDVSVVTFYDPNCPYCREAASVLKKLINDDGKVRLVLKELPMLGPDSAAHAGGRSSGQIFRHVRADAHHARPCHHG
jgi:protein-disulfide isomerase